AGPRSIVPGQGDAAAPPAAAPRVRTAVTSTAPSAAPASGGGSYVQVTSRRTEGEAQAEFRALQGKFPDQLNGREPMIRRADLGEKCTFFRAYVGPFASPEEAAQLRSGLKAAGGNCIAQPNCGFRVLDPASASGLSGRDARLHFRLCRHETFRR